MLKTDSSKVPLRAHVPDSLKHLLRRVKSALMDSYATKSYSQEGEDMILRRVLGNTSQGFYVDVGAHHPKRFSNTYYYYKCGWNGINIDAMPGNMALFDRCRQRDTNLEMGVSNKEEDVEFYMFEEPALNTFDKKTAIEYEQAGAKVIATQLVRTFPLKDILKRYMPAGRVIDFMSVDVEGLDYQVLESNDWELFRPRFVLVEALDFDIEALQNNEMYAYIRRQGYRLFSKTLNTILFRDARISK